MNFKMPVRIMNEQNTGYYYIVEDKNTILARCNSVTVAQSIKDAINNAHRKRALEEVLKWIADHDPKGEGDAYWYSEQCGMRARAVLDGES